MSVPLNKPHKIIHAGMIFLTILLCMGITRIHAQSSCTEFWLTFGEHYLRPIDTGYFGPGVFGIENYFEIRIQSMHQANGQILFTHSGDTIPFHVSPGHIFSHRLSYKQAQGCYNKTMDKQDNLSICILSDSSINVSAISRIYADADATLVLPVEALGCDYYIFRQNGNTTPKLDELCVIIGTANGTIVTMGGQLLCTLNKGETYYFSIPHSASGVQRRLKSNKRVALFNVENPTNIPHFGITDKLYEQYYPINTSGKEFFIPASDMGSDFVQIMATENNTNIAVSGGTLRTDISGPGKLNGLYAGEWVWIETTIADSGCYITTDKPVLACSFLPCCNFRNPLSLQIGKGDPAITWVSPLCQRVKSCIIKPFEMPPAPTDTIIPQYHAMIVVPAIGKDSCYVRVNEGNNEALFGGKWYNHPSGWSYYDMLLDKDSTYIFSNNAFGLQAYSYGLARTESYYLLASAKFRNWERSFTANDTHYLKLPELFFCEQEITFQAVVADSLSTQPGHICWYIDSVEEITARDQLVWKKFFTKGNYHIRMEIRYNDEFDTNSYSISSTLHITSLEADVSTTPELCRQADGTIICSANSAFPQQVVYILDSNTYKQDTIRGLTAGWYHVSISDSVCLLEQDIFIDSIGGPLAEFEAVPATATVNYAVSFHDQSTDPYAPICSWHWDMGDSHTDSIQNPNHIFTAEGAYNVTLLVTDTNGCSDSISHVINIVSPFFFPNVFTPVGTDGSLYYFRPVEDKGLFDAFEMTVYNRWGTTVWQQSCNDGQCPHYEDNLFWWDGCDSSGKRVSDGVYYWVAKAYSKDMPPIIQQGSVTIFSKP